MLVIYEQDNVGVLLEDAKAGDTAVCAEIRVTCLQDIDYCHTAPPRHISRHDDYIKYGEIIGYALRDVKKGEWVHTHNLDDVRGRGSKL